MKEFTVTIDRTVKQVRTITIKAESKEQAYDAAMDIAVQNEGWDGKEYDTDYEINIEEVPNIYIDKYGNPYDSESENCWPAGGGLHKDCEFNADALYAYYTMSVGKGQHPGYLRMLRQRGASLGLYAHRTHRHGLATRLGVY